MSKESHISMAHSQAQPASWAAWLSCGITLTKLQPSKGCSHLGRGITRGRGAQRDHIEQTKDRKGNRGLESLTWGYRAGQPLRQVLHSTPACCPLAHAVSLPVESSKDSFSCSHTCGCWHVAREEEDNNRSSKDNIILYIRSCWKGPKPRKLFFPSSMEFSRVCMFYSEDDICLPRRGDYSADYFL